MKKIVILIIFIFMMPLLFSCQKKDVLIIYNWGEYFDPKIYKRFTKETGIDIREITFDSSQIAETSLRTNNHYDLAFATEFTIDKLKDEILDGNPIIQKIDKKRLTFDESIYSSDLNLMVSKLEEKIGYNFLDYAIPYVVGTFGILYNSDVIKDEDVIKYEWDIIKKIQGEGHKIAIYDSAVEFIATSIMANYDKVCDFFDPKMGDEILPRAEKWLSEIPIRNRNFITDGIFDEVPSEKLNLVFAISGDAAEIMSRAIEEKSKLNLKYYIPNEMGTNIWFDSMIIPRGANLELSYKFINFLYKEENNFFKNAYDNCISYGFQSPLDKVINAQKEYYLKIVNDNSNKYSKIQKYYAQEIYNIYNYEIDLNDEVLIIPKKYRNKIDELWIKYRSSSSNLFN